MMAPLIAPTARADAGNGDEHAEDAEFYVPPAATARARAIPPRRRRRRAGPDRHGRGGAAARGVRGDRRWRAYSRAAKRHGLTATQDQGNDEESRGTAMPAAAVQPGCVRSSAVEHRAERQDRADREVDAADEDDHGHADGDKPGDRDLPQHVGQVARREKMFRPSRSPARRRRRRKTRPRVPSRASSAGEGAAKSWLARVRRRGPPRLRRQRRRTGFDRRGAPRRGERHDRLLRRLAAVENAGLPAFPHDQDAVGEKQQFRQFRTTTTMAMPSSASRKMRS